MEFLAAALTTAKHLAKAALQAAATHRGARNPFLHFLFSFGLCGLFLVSIVDSSFVPLPVPGVTDIMVIVMAAQHQSIILLVLLSTVGSAIGGYLSHLVGQRGGMAFLEKRVNPRVFKRVRHWMESHAILSVAVPALLPPPMPLSPFVLAAGALKMSRKKFMIAFTVSRSLRHIIAAWLGIHYGRHIVRIWNGLSAKYAMPVVIVIWVGIIVSCVFAFRQLYKTSRAVGVRRTGNLVDRPNPTA
jgi:membrane protein YqaA with SNARE-associated domain